MISLNPYSLLNLADAGGITEGLGWFKRPSNWSAIMGSLNRRIRAVKAELELSDGRLSWLPKLCISETIIHRVVGGLDDSGWHTHHWTLFRLPLLNRFLMHGELGYFHSLEHAPYPLIAELSGVASEDPGHKEFVAFVSPFFRDQLAKAIKTALDIGNYNVARMLFTTSTPIVGTHLDGVLEPVRRHFSLRREALKVVEAEVARRKDADGCLQSQLASQESSFLNLLPRHLAETDRDDLALAYRSLSVTIANECEDCTEADVA